MFHLTGRGRLAIGNSFLENLVGLRVEQNMDLDEAPTRLSPAFSAASGYWKEKYDEAGLGAWVQKYTGRGAIPGTSFDYPAPYDLNVAPNVLNHTRTVEIAPLDFKHLRAVCSRHKITIPEAATLLMILSQLNTMQRHYQTFDKPQPPVCETTHALNLRRFAPDLGAKYDGFATALGTILLKTEVLRQVVKRAAVDGIYRTDGAFWEELVPAMQSQMSDFKVCCYIRYSYFF
ncbi:hypothetical protein BOTBODRAFT_496149 [Botryobasidium botryosum FD-172 SS1]|uniref:Uncharacterized protein n=1 Tax=Botryobasidium botryosum (strain FD-172 SS1) TaxID=930990 RepID=A0A067M6V4_BOTB1|nr:hypothetical protein BOTBODRAFT_496149 [Botryobasidium botryosum FD-172 SS1]